MKNNQSIVHDFIPTPPQILLLTGLLAKDSGKAVIAIRDWLDSVDFDSIGVAEMRLMPILYSRLQELRISHSLVGRIRGLYRRAWYVDRTMRMELRLLMNSLSDVAKPIVLLKGAALGLYAYSESAHRPFDDFDLFMREPERLSVFNTLVGKGALLLNCGFHAQTVRLLNGRKVDIHQSPYHYAFSSHHAEPLFSRLKLIKDVRGNNVFYTLGDTDQLLHTICHGLQPSTISPIRWVVDAVHLIRQYDSSLDWELLVQEAQRLDFVECALIGLKEMKRYESNLQIEATILALEKLTTPRAVEAWRTSFRHTSGATNLWAYSKRNAVGNFDRLALIYKYIKLEIWEKTSFLIFSYKIWRGFLKLFWVLILRSVSRLLN